MSQGYTEAMLVSGLIRSAHLFVRFGKQIGEILVENEQSCAFIVKINIDVPIHEFPHPRVRASAIAYYERASAASERVHTELRENPEH